MISLKRTIIVATVAGTVLLGGGAVASACPGDAEASAGSTGGSVHVDPPAEQETAAEPTLSPACTAALVAGSQDRSARFSSVAAQVASACAQDSVTVGQVIDYVTGAG